MAARALLRLHFATLASCGLRTRNQCSLGSHHLKDRWCIDQFPTLRPKLLRGSPVLPQRDPRPAEVPVGNRPILALPVIVINPRQVSGIVFYERWCRGTPCARAQHVVPVVDIEQSNAVLAD